MPEKPLDSLPQNFKSDAVEVVLSSEQAAKARDAVVRKIEDIATEVADKHPEAADRVRNTVDALSGVVDVQDGVISVTKKNVTASLDTSKKSFQASMDTFLGEIEAEATYVDGEIAKQGSADLDLGPVGVHAKVERVADGDRTLSATIDLPADIKLWVEKNKDGITAGAKIEWKSDDEKTKGTFVLKRSEDGHVTIEGKLVSEAGTNISVSSKDGLTAEVKVSQKIDLGIAGNLSFEAKAISNGARLTEYGGTLSYTVRF